MRQLSSMLFGLVVTWGAGIAPLTANAQDFPSKPISIVVPLPPGGGSDRAARLLADHFTNAWKQPVVVENRPGGSGVVGASAVARAQPDGHTLLFATPSISTLQVLVHNSIVDVIRDFAPVSLLCISPFILAINAAVPAKAVQEFLAHAKANPGKLNYGTFGGGQGLTFEYFKQVAGLNIVAINYKGEAPMMLAIAANEVQVTIASALTIMPLARAGKLRALAVTTRARGVSTPEIAPLAESGVPNFDIGVWYGVLAPAKTPPEIVRKLTAEIAAFTKRPEIAKSFADVNYVVQGSSAEVYAQLIATEVKRWNEVAKSAGIKPE